ncbi:MAG: ATP-binding protein [Armatimonadota bacterium]
MESPEVELSIPCAAEYVGVARLVVLGVASRMSFCYDEVEDLRQAVGEACTSAIERARAKHQPDSRITIKCIMEHDKKLTVQVADTVLGYNSRGHATLVGTDLDESNIGALLMEILVDEIQAESKPDQGTTVTMVKYVGRRSQ